MGFFKSLATMQGLISLIIVVLICLGVYIFAKSKGKKASISTKDVVAIGIGAALFAAVSFLSIPIGPNTSFRIAIALLVIFRAIYGPIVGFLVGFIGHALNDALMYGSVWWSWVFMSAMIGLFAGFIFLNKSFSVKTGQINKSHIIKMYLYSIFGILAGSVVSYLGDVFLYGEPADKVWLQIILANISNFVVIAVVGIPAIIALAKRNSKGSLEKE